MNKYKNKVVVVDGQRFASLKEFRRWNDLKILEKAGIISKLDRQTRYPLSVKGELICTYIADHTYVENGEFVVEDVKSDFTRKLPVYRMKKKLLKACYGLEIKEV